MQQQAANPYRLSLQSQAAAAAQFQQAHGLSARQWLAAQELAVARAASPFAGYLNAVRSVGVSLPLDWAEFCDHVQDWSTDRLLGEVRRRRAARGVRHG